MYELSSKSHDLAADILVLFPIGSRLQGLFFSSSQSIPDWTFEQLYHSCACQSRTLVIATSYLLFKRLSSCLFIHRAVFPVNDLHALRWIPEIDLIAHKRFDCRWVRLCHFGVPLNKRSSTFLRALVKESGSTTEKMIKKMSAEG